MKEARIPFYLMFKHLLRGNKWTLSLIVFLISITFVNLVFVSSLFDGIIDLTDRQIIDTYSGNFSISPTSDNNYIEGSDNILKKLRIQRESSRPAPIHLFPNQH
jgi:ABC-type lipoprotein release transport system permease subunit